MSKGRIKVLPFVYRNEFQMIKKFFLDKYGITITDNQVLEFVSHSLPDTIDKKIENYCRIVPSLKEIKCRTFKSKREFTEKWTALHKKYYYLPSEHVVSCAIIMLCNKLYKDYL